MSTFAAVMLSLAAGYVGGVMLGIGLVYLNSGRADRQQEAFMTGCFVVGPIGAILALIGTLVYRHF